VSQKNQTSTAFSNNSNKSNTISSFWYENKQFSFTLVI